MDKPIVEFDRKRRIVDLTCREWSHVSDQFVTMTYDEFEEWLLSMLVKTKEEKKRDVNGKV